MQGRLRKGALLLLETLLLCKQIIIALSQPTSGTIATEFAHVQMIFSVASTDVEAKLQSSSMSGSLKLGIECVALCTAFTYARWPTKTHFTPFSKQLAHRQIGPCLWLSG